MRILLGKLDASAKGAHIYLDVKVASIDRMPLDAPQQCFRTSKVAKSQFSGGK